MVGQPRFVFVLHFIIFVCFLDCQCCSYIQEVSEKRKKIMADFVLIRNACTKKLAEEAELRLQLRGVSFKTICASNFYVLEIQTKL